MRLRSVTPASSFRTSPHNREGWAAGVLGVTAAGFVAYGFYQIIHARYLHIRLKRRPMERLLTRDHLPLKRTAGLQKQVNILH